jgi:exodeoxyribonuclease V alpha subunit
MRRGPAGVDALRAAGLPAVTVREAVGRTWPGVVAVIPPEACGVLSRPLVYAMFSRATRHLSVVHAAGAGLATAVRETGARPRRTRLADLLRAHGM